MDAMAKQCAFFSNYSRNLIRGSFCLKQTIPAPEELFDEGVKALTVSPIGHKMVGLKFLRKGLCKLQWLKSNTEEK